MRWRLKLAALIMVTALPHAPQAGPAAAQVAPEQEVVALIVEGTGFGHGRGMSQWGAYGRAVNGGQSWTQILDAYYGGTTLGSVATSSRIRVRLLAHDGDSTVGVISTSAHGAMGIEHHRLRRDPGAGDGDGEPLRHLGAHRRRRARRRRRTGWTRVAANVAGPITFTTTVNESSGAAGDVLGLCANDGSVTHYRGRIQLTARQRRQPPRRQRRRRRELPARRRAPRGVDELGQRRRWCRDQRPAGAGGGGPLVRLGAEPLRQLGGYATTCDTQTCQVYGGAARRASATAATASGGVCESGNATFECANTNRAIAETAGRVRRSSSGAIVSTEFSASNGPRTAGGTFPAINDPFDDVPQNPNHRWTRIIDGDVVAAAYGLGTLTAATTEADPATPFVGVWDNRVRLTGTGGTVVVSDLNFRIRVRTAVARVHRPRRGPRGRGVDLDADDRRLRRSQHDGELDVGATGAARRHVHRRRRTTTRQNRCTADCGLSGVGAAASVPIGTDLVLVELGYNSPTSNFGARIDSLMRALEARQVERVVWVNLSTRSGRADFVAANQALAAARSRWPDLFVLDWASYSAGSAGNRNRWFATDGIHLTATGQAEMARFVRNQLAPLADFPVGSSIFTWDRRDRRRGRCAA